MASCFLIRSWRSTLVLTLMVVSAVSALIFLSALAVGVNDAMINNAVSLFSGHISGMNIPEDITEKDLLQNGVAGVLKRVPVAGFLLNKEHMAMVTLICISPEKEKKFTALWKKKRKGRYLEPGKNEVFLSQSIADQLHCQPGDTLEFSPGKNTTAVTLTVCGTYTTGVDQFDRGLSFFTMGATVLPEKTGPWNAAIFLEHGVDEKAMTHRYKNGKTAGIPFKTWTDLMPDLKQLIELNYLSMGIVILIVFMVVSSGIACAFSIFILRDIREYGIMKVMGITPLETALLIFSEVILINLAASAMGVTVGVVGVSVFQNIGIDLSDYTSHNQYFVVSGIIFPRLTAFSIWLPPVSALVFSIPSAIWPTVSVIRKNAADILRSI